MAPKEARGDSDDPHAGDLGADLRQLPLPGAPCPMDFRAVGGLDSSVIQKVLQILKGRFQGI